MSQLSKNIAANYASQVYVTLIGILLLPMYIKYMGSEAYGLVGFFAMLQAWFNILDLGLTPTIGRETARYQGGVLSAIDFRRLYRILAVIFSAVALVGGGALVFLSSFITNRWLNVEVLQTDEVLASVQIMGVSVALRWMCGLFRGVIAGSERLVWLSGFNVVISTLRFAGVFASMWYFGFSPIVFFIHQLFVAFIEFIGLALKTKQLLPTKSGLKKKIGWSFKPVKPLLKFSLTIAFTASVWVFVTQTDKLVLSGILSLENYGYFTLSVLVANGIMIAGGPVSNSIMPRMARLYAESKHKEMIKVYRQSTQLIAIIAGSAAITLVTTAKPLLIAWTGDAHLANQAAPILRLYATGNLFLCIASFSYYLQYAKGNLYYHLVGNIGLIITLIPSIIFVAKYFGGVGAGYVWVILNSLFLFFWVAYIHAKLEPGLHWKWLLGDAASIIVPSGLFAVFISISTTNLALDSRLYNLIYVTCSGVLITICSLLFSSVFRNKLTQKLSSIFNGKI